MTSHLLSEAGGPSFRSSIGVMSVTEPLRDTSFDTVIVGGSALPGALTPGVIKFLRRAVRDAVGLPQPAPARFVLAEAGLLDGRRRPPLECGA